MAANANANPNAPKPGVASDASGPNAAAGAFADAFDGPFDVHPAGPHDLTPFGVCGDGTCAGVGACHACDAFTAGTAWPFAAASALLPPRALPSFASFAYPSFPPLPSVAVPVWSAASATGTGPHGVTAAAVSAPKMSLDLVELPDRFCAVADVPGVQAGDIDLRIDRDTRVVTVAVVRRRTAHCDCNFVQSCTPATSTSAASPAAASGSAGAAANTAAGDSKAPAPALTQAQAQAKPQAPQAKTTCTSACDGACKARAVHCRDCEAKGERMGPASPSTALVHGCCGYCAGALHLRPACGGPSCSAGRKGDANCSAAYVYRRLERQYGRAQRAFRVPSDADLTAVSSSLRGGVLTITVPRAKQTSAKAPASGPALAEAEAKVKAEEMKAHAQSERAGALAAATAADPFRRSGVLKHHVTAPHDNPTVVHERVMRQAVAAAADPIKRAALLRHHMSRADPLTAWAYHSPFAAYSAVLPDVMTLARDFDVASRHVPRPPYDTGAQNPLLAHERVMRQAVAAAQAHTAQAHAHAAAATHSHAAANAQMSIAAMAREAAAEMSAEAAAASAAATSL